jgi:hypothetical protein
VYATSSSGATKVAALTASCQGVVGFLYGKGGGGGVWCVRAGPGRAADTVGVATTLLVSRGAVSELLLPPPPPPPPSEACASSESAVSRRPAPAPAAERAAEVEVTRMKRWEACTCVEVCTRIISIIAAAGW